MAGVADTGTIDLVAQDSGGRFLVIMVESRKWGEEAAQPSQLKEKINAYAGFITDGSLARHYPETAGQPVDVQLNCPQPPTGEFSTILDHATIQLRRLGIGFRLHLTREE
jgi:hypothetical protein